MYVISRNKRNVSSNLRHFLNLLSVRLIKPWCVSALKKTKILVCNLKNVINILANFLVGCQHFISCWHSSRTRQLKEQTYNNIPSHISFILPLPCFFLALSDILYSSIFFYTNGKLFLALSCSEWCRLILY